MCEGWRINPLNAKLNPICYLQALLEAHHILHVSRIRVKSVVQSHDKGAAVGNRIERLTVVAYVIISVKCKQDAKLCF